jgi:hypothetical protein
MAGVKRLTLLLPLLLVGCGDGQRTDFPALHYGYLQPIRLNVATIVIEQHFRASGIAPDVTQLDPAPPADALRAMAQDRLKSFGTSGRAVFIIQDASMIRQGSEITGSTRVRLEIRNAENALVGFAEAKSTAQHSGRVGDLREVLYNMTKSMMDSMNVEFELQVNNALRGWLIGDSAAPTPVEQAPLERLPQH